MASTIARVGSLVRYSPFSGLALRSRPNVSSVLRNEFKQRWYESSCSGNAQSSAAKRVSQRSSSTVSAAARRTRLTCACETSPPRSATCCVIKSRNRRAQRLRPSSCAVRPIRWSHANGAKAIRLRIWGGLWAYRVRCGPYRVAEFQAPYWVS